MNSETVVMCVVALILGMLLAHMLKSVCGCKVVEGLSIGSCCWSDGDCGDAGGHGYCKKASNNESCAEIDALGTCVATAKEAGYDWEGPGPYRKQGLDGCCFSDDNCHLLLECVPYSPCAEALLDPQPDQFSEEQISAARESAGRCSFIS